MISRPFKKCKKELEPVENYDSLPHELPHPDVEDYGSLINQLPRLPIVDYEDEYDEDDDLDYKIDREDLDANLDGVGFGGGVGVNIGGGGADISAEENGISDIVDTPPGVVDPPPPLPPLPHQPHQMHHLDTFVDSSSSAFSIPNELPNKISSVDNNQVVEEEKNQENGNENNASPDWSTGGDASSPHWSTSSSRVEDGKKTKAIWIKYGNFDDPGHQLIKGSQIDRKNT